MEAMTDERLAELPARLQSRAARIDRLTGVVPSLCGQTGAVEREAADAIGKLMEQVAKLENEREALHAELAARPTVLPDEVREFITRAVHGDEQWMRDADELLTKYAAGVPQGVAAGTQEAVAWLERRPDGRTFVYTDLNMPALCDFNDYAADQMGLKVWERRGIILTEPITPESQTRHTTLPTQADNPRGLHQRYIVTKASGEPVDPRAVYFVLRIDLHGDDPCHIAACRHAAMDYVSEISGNPEADHLTQMANELRLLIFKLGSPQPDYDVTKLPGYWCRNEHATFFHYGDRAASVDLVGATWGWRPSGGEMWTVRDANKEVMTREAAERAASAWVSEEQPR